MSSDSPGMRTSARLYFQERAVDLASRLSAFARSSVWSILAWTFSGHWPPPCRSQLEYFITLAWSSHFPNPLPPTPTRAVRPRPSRWRRSLRPCHPHRQVFSVFAPRGSRVSSRMLLLPLFFLIKQPLTHSSFYAGPHCARNVMVSPK